MKESGLLVQGQFSQAKLQEVVEVSKTRMKKLSDIVGLSDFFFTNKLIYEKKMLSWQKMGELDIVESLKTSEQALQEIKKWDIKNLEKELFLASEKFNIKKGYHAQNRGYLLWPLRVALSGKQSSPSPFEIAGILGREKTLKRVEDAIKLYE